MIFLDNLYVHKTKESYEIFKELKVTEIFNVPYSPDFKRIDSFFSLVKGEYKKLMLQHEMKGTPTNTVTLIEESIKSMSHDKVRK